MNFKKIILTLFITFLFCNRADAIKIGLITEEKEIKIASSVSAEIYDNYRNAVLYEIKPMKVYEFKPEGKQLAVIINRKPVGLGTNQIVIRTKEPGYLCAKRAWYRGDFIINNMGYGATLINDVPLEEYLKGVVPSEMPSSWEHDAHKAQAIAARSYAIANMCKRAKYGYDLKDTPEDQAYGGATAETPQTNDAVTETQGLVLIHDGKIIPAYYHASSGGKTLSAGEVWNHDLPYIQSVNGYDWGTRKSGHGVGMSQHGANNLANKGFSARQILSYFYKDIKFSRLKTKED